MRRAAPLLALLLLAPVGGCSREHYERTADRDVYGALSCRRGEVPLVAGSLNVVDADAEAERVRRLGEATLDVQGALRLAASASRDYRTQREDVYLAALNYVGRRHDFDAKFSLGGPVAIAGDDSSTTGSASPGAGLSKALQSGGSLVLNLVTNFLKAFRGDPLETAQTILSADIVLPLARGGRLVAREGLTQAERDVLYALRSYARFQQDFAVNVASTFYRVVEQRDTLANEEATYKSLATVYDRAQAFGPKGAGRLPDFQVDQARQDVLRADDRRIRAKQSYEASLDGLKILVGLPVTARLTIPDDALEVLRARGLEAPDLSLDAALSVSHSARLDLANARDQQDDADRKVEVAADGLGPQVDLTLGAALTGPDTQPANLSRAKGSGNVGLGLNLPVERERERDAYRSSLIAAARAKRAVEGLEDQVLSQVRRAWRTLDQARQSYKIQEEGVRLSERRVESADLNYQAGKATTRDVLEAQDARIEARNALTQALVDYAIARLEFERDAGVLKPGPLLGISETR